MRKQVLIPLLILVALMMSSCITIHLPAEPTKTPPTSTTGDVFKDLGSQTQPSAEVVQATEEPKQTAEAIDASPEPVEQTATTVPEDTVQGQCAYITGMSMRMDGQIDITFDYVDWLSGEDAEEKYLEDNPGATSEDIEGAGIYEIGYIRNVNDRLRTFSTSPETKYFLPDPENISTIVEVGYDEFRDRMFPAVEIGENGYLTFVQIDLIGDTITKIEWLYLP